MPPARCPASGCSVGENRQLHSVGTPAGSPKGRCREAGLPSLPHLLLFPSPKSSPWEADREAHPVAPENKVPVLFCSGSREADKQVSLPLSPSPWRAALTVSARAAGGVPGRPLSTSVAPFLNCHLVSLGRLEIFFITFVPICRSTSHAEYTLLCHVNPKYSSVCGPCQVGFLHSRHRYVLARASDPVPFAVCAVYGESPSPTPREDCFPLTSFTRVLQRTLSAAAGATQPRAV